MDSDELTRRNLAIAERFYEGYHRSVERGRLEGAFSPEDFAEHWVFSSPFLGGENPQERGPGLAEGATANHALISSRIPDYKMDDFRAWPTDGGCAWRWCVNGTGIDGRSYRFWEQLFLWTDGDAKVTRFEFYDDWYGFLQTLTFAYETPIADLAANPDYGVAPWTPPAPITLNAAPRRPVVAPPDPSVRRNEALARRFFEGSTGPGDFAGGWVLFSPWWGDVEPGTNFDLGVARARVLQATRTRLPDFGQDTFETWPTAEGSASRWRAHGTAPDGVHYETWLQAFLTIDGGGRITRVELFADWQAFPQFAGYVTGLDIDTLWDAASHLAWLDHAAQRNVEP